jgi:putative nucleotidyltransferase with HDIG domain
VQPQEEPSLERPADTAYSGDEVERAYEQSAAFSAELRSLYEERRSTRAELEDKIREVERYQQQLLAYARDLSQVHRRLQGTYLATLEALARAVESRDYDTGGHSQRVVRYALLTGEALGLKSSELRTLRYGALLHDVGKVSTPDAVLLKPGALSPEEWTIMQRHAEVGFQILRDIEFLVDALPIVRHHHERFDGKGYPSELRGDAIPLGARIFCVADTIDAMTSDRPYRAALPMERAIEEVRSKSGTQFDPQIAEVFLTVAPQLL